MNELVDVGQWLDVSLPAVLDHLRAHEVQELAWMEQGGWAIPSLRTHGFRPLIDVITLRKTDRKAPNVDTSPVGLRPPSDADLATIAAIDRMAFIPIWWRSEESVRRRAATASLFTVADRGGEVVGYVEWERHRKATHLTRLAVVPDLQGQGIGTLLLKHALVSTWQRGAETVSLNTQRTNLRSRRLYDRFGFVGTGDCVTVWVLRL